MIRAVAVFMICCAVSLVTVEIAGASSATCTRTDLQAVVDRYIEAAKTGVPSAMPLVSQVRYLENKREIPIGQGIWQTTLNIAFHRSILDVDACETFTEVIQTDETHPNVLGTRLKVVDGAVSEIETLVTDEGDWLFDADNYLLYSQKENWDIIPPGQRSDRQALIDAAAAYFDVFSDKSAKVPWGVPCARLEGGLYTAKDSDDPEASCNVGIPEDVSVEITNRHYVADPDLGAVVGFVDFGSSEVPDSHLFRLENGRLRYIHTLTVCLIPNCGFPAPPDTGPSQ